MATTGARRVSKKRGMKRAKNRCTRLAKKGETTGAAIFASYSFLPNKINKKTQ